MKKIQRLVDSCTPIHPSSIIEIPETVREVLPEGFPKIVTLCGSTRFKEEYLKANFQLTMSGVIVLSVGWFSHADDNFYSPSEEEKYNLDQLHFRKIDISDGIYVVNPSIPTCILCKKPCESSYHAVGASGYSNSKCCNAEVNCKPYIGSSTRNEIEYALKNGKTVDYLNPPVLGG